VTAPTLWLVRCDGDVIATRHSRAEAFRAKRLHVTKCPLAKHGTKVVRVTRRKKTAPERGGGKR